MPRYLPVAFASREQLRAGQLRDPLRQVMAQPLPEAPATSGASVAGAVLLETLEARRAGC
jgi:hypothetical protein